MSRAKAGALASAFWIVQIFAWREGMKRVAIVGGGVAGVAAAYFLARRLATASVGGVV